MGAGGILENRWGETPNPRKFVGFFNGSGEAAISWWLAVEEINSSSNKQKIFMCLVLDTQIYYQNYTQNVGK